VQQQYSNIGNIKSLRKRSVSHTRVRIHAMRCDYLDPVFLPTGQVGSHDPRIVFRGQGQGTATGRARQYQVGKTIR
jgi:hypothetical protein